MGLKFRTKLLVEKLVVFCFDFHEFSKKKQRAPRFTSIKTHIFRFDFTRIKSKKQRAPWLIKNIT